LPVVRKSRIDPTLTRFGRLPDVRLKCTPNGQSGRSAASLARPGVEFSEPNVLYSPFREATPMSPISGKPSIEPGSGPSPPTRLTGSTVRSYRRHMPGSRVWSVTLPRNSRMQSADRESRLAPTYSPSSARPPTRRLTIYPPASPPTSPAARPRLAVAPGMNRGVSSGIARPPCIDAAGSHFATNPGQRHVREIARECFVLFKGTPHAPRGRSEASPAADSCNARARARACPGTFGTFSALFLVCHLLQGGTAGHPSPDPLSRQLEIRP
jgi:hypothetical protein